MNCKFKKLNELLLNVIQLVRINLKYFCNSIVPSKNIGIATKFCHKKITTIPKLSLQKCLLNSWNNSESLHFNYIFMAFSHIRCDGAQRYNYENCVTAPILLGGAKFYCVLVKVLNKTRLYT